jgi:hypothetical protein
VSEQRLQEELLEEALDACMEEQLSFIPPEREIARMHTFSEKFQAAMEELLRTKGRPQKKQITEREFAYGFNRAAACILAVLLVGAVSAGGWLIFSRSDKDSMSESAVITEDTAVEEEAAEEDAEAAYGTEDEGTGSIAYSDEAEFMGSTIYLAAAQYIPEDEGNVKTRINSPVIARDAESVKITIGNLEEQPVYYYKNMDLEVLIDGAWYLVPAKEEASEEEQNQMVMLEPNMAQDEEILLGNYELDYDAEQYRIVTYLDGLTLCSRFRFENLEADIEEALEGMGTEGEE